MSFRLFRGALAATMLATSGAVAGNGGDPLNSAELVLLGPVEAAGNGVAVILGQSFSLCELGDVEVGATMAAFGRIKPTGTVEIARVQRLGLYVPGATRVVLTGLVSRLSSTLGRASVNGVSVDLNSLQSLGQPPMVAVGMLIRVSGTQPNRSGLLLAHGISGGSLNGISGGSLNGISGGSLNGISGGSLNGISGGSLNGISGGSLNGISGGSLNGISGGSLNGISGGSLNGISGGSLNGISGGSLNGISGGSLNGISGGSLNGISGGSLNGISGGSLNGISGGSLNGISGGSLNGISCGLL